MRSDEKVNGAQKVNGIHDTEQQRERATAAAQSQRESNNIIIKYTYKLYKYSRVEAHSTIFTD